METGARARRESKQQCLAVWYLHGSLDEAALVVGARRSTMDELPAVTVEVEKVLVF